MRGGGAVDLPTVGAVVVGTGGAGGTVVVTRGFVPKTQQKIRRESHSHSWDKYAHRVTALFSSEILTF